MSYVCAHTHTHTYTYPDTNKHTDLLQLLLEDVAVLGGHDGLDRGAQHLDSVLGKHPRLPQLHAAVEGGLPTELQTDAIGALFLNDLLDEAGDHGQEVDLVRYAPCRLHRGNVGVDEDGLAPLLLESLDGLRARVVKLARLSDLQVARKLK